MLELVALLAQRDLVGERTRLLDGGSGDDAPDIKLANENEILYTGTHLSATAR